MRNPVQGGITLIRLQRKTVAIGVLVALSLSIAACSKSKAVDTTAAPAESSAETTPAPAADTTTAAPADTTAPAPAADTTAAAPAAGKTVSANNYSTPLKGVCPDPVRVQMDWVAEVEHAAMWQLIGPGGKMEQGKYSGPLGKTGINFEILMAGKNLDPTGGLTSFSTLFSGNPVLGVKPELAYSNTDDLIQQSKSFPMLAVVTPLEKSPIMQMWDPQVYPDITADNFKIPAGAKMYASFKDKGYPAALVGKGLVTPDQIVDGYFGGSDKWTAGTQDKDGKKINNNFQQGYASNEVYAYEKDPGSKWKQPVAYALIADIKGLGYRVYAQEITIDRARKAELAPCLKGLVPIIQQATVDYAANPQPINDAITAFNDKNYGEDYWKTSKELNAAGSKIMVDKGILGNGPDKTAANFDEARVQELLDALKPTFEKNSADSFDPAVKVSDIVTNEFIDPTIGFP
jgi:hypothetical protein